MRPLSRQEIDEINEFFGDDFEVVEHVDPRQYLDWLPDPFEEVLGG